MDPRDRRRRGWRIFTVLVAVALVLFFSGAASWPDRLKGMRPVNERDELFRYMAQELAEPALCAKIPWSVESGGGFFLAPSYERSNCYAFIAGRTRNPWLCWRVRRLGAWSFLSRQTSMWSCLQDARRGLSAGIAMSPTSLAGFFAELGYEPDRLHLEGITPPLVRVKDVYRSLPTRADLLARIEKAVGAPGRGAGATISDPRMLAYLDDLAALTSRDPAWCDRIPDAERLPNQPASFRNWCLFTLASNTRDARPCERIPLGAGDSDPRLSLRAKCTFQAGSRFQAGQYGPEVPDDDRTRALITLLGYDIPLARDLPPEDVQRAYERFVQEVSTGTSAAHAAARRRLVERALNAP
jgi:hypothetical protein